MPNEPRHPASSSTAGTCTATRVTTIHGDLRITTPERTILDIAPTLDDEQLENVIALALRNRRTTERKLRAQLHLREGARGTRRIRAVLDGGPQWTASQRGARVPAHAA